ncbi:hypothetical protein L873DRAFT_1808462 [Choiromyces venosus 120613-1]|uniref:Uncharacterized protein n=1 Tax=Choiromyces venosus 120613-1 TaxID=1336337 RepID=A0A3N4JLQ9_9PEZI|nr:hypothetical protein L873DRAFT_1808462 [Choiromyces venosus 120613-1]
MFMSISTLSEHCSGHGDRMSIISTSLHHSGRDEMSISSEHQPSVGITLSYPRHKNQLYPIWTPGSTACIICCTNATINKATSTVSTR